VLSNSKTKQISIDGLNEINHKTLSHFKGKDINISIGGIKELNIDIADVLSDLKLENSSTSPKTSFNLRVPSATSINTARELPSGVKILAGLLLVSAI
jgi:hypothetical protein